MYWSVRRELWENRSIYIAPLIAAAVYLFGFLISLFWLPRSMRALAALRLRRLSAIQLAMPYAHAGMLIMASRVHRRGSSTRSTRCMANVAIAAFCSGSRCRFPILRPCLRRRAFRS